MRFKELDTVTLLHEREGVRAKASGTVLEVYADTGSYLVEFDDVEKVIELKDGDLLAAGGLLSQA
ncbi:MAG: hypothetical protein ACK4F4_07390 [Hylemonella sp.]|uniref:hypothetical protein n=1 Tax=Hylemonella sp. TaxID=2066020 RepID=UPI00391A6540